MIAATDQLTNATAAATDRTTVAMSAGRQTLNAADRFMQVAHDTLLRHGHTGFQCQTHVWFRGRVEVAALRSAVARLSHAYPVITSRLVVPTKKKEAPFWNFRPGEQATLHEHWLDDAGHAAGWAHAEQFYLEPFDLARIDPISFHLLHFPDGRDMLLLRFSHTLMDGKAPEFVLAELDRAFLEENLDAAAPPSPHTDEMAAHLAKFPRRRRARAALRVIGDQMRLPVHSATLVPPEARDLVFQPFRILVRSIDEERTERIVARVRRLCGFSNLAPAALASIFRCVRKFTQHRVRPSTAFKTDVPLNLRPPGRGEPIFRNFMTFVQMSAQARELDNGDELVQRLSARMRDQLRREIDLGSLQMMQCMSPHARLLGAHMFERARKHPLTLGFGFLGPVRTGLERLFGVEVEWLYCLNIAASPPGITLQVNQFRGRLNLAMTYIEKTVPTQLAESFLAAIEDDMLGSDA